MSSSKTYLDSVKNRNAYELIHRLLMRDGRIKYVEEHGYTVYDAKGSPLRSVWNRAGHHGTRGSQAKASPVE
ncbi:MAG: hypothetical protein ACJ0BN_06785 [Limisphaerales bacterium]